MFCSLLCFVSSQPPNWRPGSCGETPQGRRTFLLQPFTNPKTPPEIKRTLHRAVKMQLPLGRSRHLVHWVLPHCLSLLAELLCKLQAMTTFGQSSRKPSLVRNPCLLLRLSRPCLRPQAWQRCQGFSWVAGTRWKLLPASARAPCQGQGDVGAASPYLDEKLPAQRVVVLIGEDLGELVESAEAFPAQGETRGKVSNAATVGSPPWALFCSLK